MKISKEARENIVLWAIERSAGTGRAGFYVQELEHYLESITEDEPKLKPGESIYQANRLSAEQEDK